MGGRTCGKVSGSQTGSAGSVHTERGHRAPLASSPFSSGVPAGGWAVPSSPPPATIFYPGTSSKNMEQFGNVPEVSGGIPSMYGS